MVEQPPLPLHGPTLQRAGSRFPAWNDARNPPFKHPGTVLHTVAGIYTSAVVHVLLVLVLQVRYVGVPIVEVLTS